MAEVSLRQLKMACRELNSVLVPKPLLALDKDEDELIAQLKEVCELFDPGDPLIDDLSKETRETLDALEIELPVEEKKSKKKGKEKETEPEEEEAEGDAEEEESEETEEQEEEEEEKPKKSNKKEESVAAKKKDKKADSKKETKKSAPKKERESKKEMPAGYTDAAGAAKILGLDEKRQARILARKGKLKAKKDGTRVLFKISDVEAYKKANKGKKEE